VDEDVSVRVLGVGVKKAEEENEEEEEEGRMMNGGT
jgi:hypothetical protein